MTVLNPSRQSSIVFPLCLVMLKLTIYSAQLCLAVLQYNRLSAPHFSVRSAALHSIRRNETETAGSLLYLLPTSLSVGITLQPTIYCAPLRLVIHGLPATIYCTPLCLEILQLTLLCFIFCTPLDSVRLDNYRLSASHLSSGIALEPTFFCAPTIHCTLHCLSILQPTLFCTLLC
jgi:hypothetical protein